MKLLRSGKTPHLCLRTHTVHSGNIKVLTNRKVLVEFLMEKVRSKDLLGRGHFDRSEINTRMRRYVIVISITLSYN